jgi:tRNA (mo5U34)-methyltransferase
MTVATGAGRDAAAVRAAIAANPLWYHTLEFPAGEQTPGWFDLRPIVDRMPWPDVAGKRCLDVGTYDGFLAFELERRGAREVVATDVTDHTGWDWPPDMRARAPELGAIAGEKGAGFRIAKELLGSSVERLEISAYDLSPERVGSFDVIVCGSLMLHLRDPLAALEAIRSVCGGVFLSAEQIKPGLALAHRRRPVAELNGAGELCQYWTPNPAGHRRMLYAAGFEVVEATRPYSIPFGVGHPARAKTPRQVWERLVQRAVTGGTGLAHVAALARPRL